MRHPTSGRFSCEISAGMNTKPCSTEWKEHSGRFDAQLFNNLLHKRFFFWHFRCTFISHNDWNRGSASSRLVSNRKLSKLIHFLKLTYISDVPENRPIIHGIKAKYRVGDTLRANCTSKFSKPAANLTWFINDIIVSMTQNIFRCSNFSFLNSPLKKQHETFSNRISMRI